MSDNRIQLLEQYIKEDPQDAFSTYALALEYVNINNTEKALSLFSTLVYNHPDYLAAYYHYGKLLEKLNNKEQANDIYLKGIAVAQKQNNRKTLAEIKEAYNSLNEIED